MLETRHVLVLLHDDLVTAVNRADHQAVAPFVLLSSNILDQGRRQWAVLGHDGFLVKSGLVTFSSVDEV